MNKALEIKDEKIIKEVLDSVEYGVLALADKTPYAVPVNFVYLNNKIYFHGSLKGRKMEIIKNNNNVSFSVISDHMVIPSYISSNEDIACPATAFFKSIIIDGKAIIVENIKEKAEMFEALMKKLQPKGGYQSLNSDIYISTLGKVAVIKIEIEKISAKFKFGQNYNKEKIEMIISKLEKSNSIEGKKTMNNIKEFYKLT